MTSTKLEFWTGLRLLSVCLCRPSAERAAGRWTSVSVCSARQPRLPLRLIGRASQCFSRSRSDWDLSWARTLRAALVPLHFRMSSSDPARIFQHQGPCSSAKLARDTVCATDVCSQPASQLLRKVSHHGRPQAGGQGWRGGPARNRGWPGCEPGMCLEIATAPLYALYVSQHAVQRACALHSLKPCCRRRASSPPFPPGNVCLADSPRTSYATLRSPFFRS